MEMKLSNSHSIVSILVGLPGSGKTTWAKDLAADDTIILSSDEIRNELAEQGMGQKDVYDKTLNELVFKTLDERYIQAVAAGKNVILDATHLKRKYREKYIKSVAIWNAEIQCVYFDVDYEKCYERNAQRERVVPKEVIRKMYFEMEDPSLAEGFNEIILVGEDGNIKGIKSMDLYGYNPSV
jgi:predicted kinase